MYSNPDQKHSSMNSNIERSYSNNISLREWQKLSRTIRHIEVECLYKPDKYMQTILLIQHVLLSIEIMYLSALENHKNKLNQIVALHFEDLSELDRKKKDELFVLFTELKSIVSDMGKIYA